MNDTASQVSVIICVRNGEKILGDCLASTVKNHPKEIIVVDGKSTDNTIAIARSYEGVTIVSDEGKGLAYARRVGIESASGQYVLFVGPDNLMEEDFINSFVSLKNQWGFDAASVQTRVFEPKSFWDRGLDFRWRCLMGTPGPLKVVGTPSMYNRNLFDEVKFSATDLSAGDDTDVAEQLVERGFKLGLIPLTVFDQNGWNAQTTWNRFRWYGTGDFYFYRKYKPVWSSKRRWKSLTHPLRQTGRYVGKAFRELEFSAIFWLVYVMFARYYGWARMSFISK